MSDLAHAGRANYCTAPTFYQLVTKPTSCPRLTNYRIPPDTGYYWIYFSVILFIAYFLR